MAFKLLNRSAGNQDLDPLVNKSRTDSWTSINWPIAKPQPSETELDISDNNHAASPSDAPGSPEGKIENSLSPKIQQERTLEKHEELTEKQQPRNLKIKTRVRMVKILLRGVNSYMTFPRFPSAAYTAHPNTEEAFDPGTPFVENKVISPTPKPVVFQPPPIEGYAVTNIAAGLRFSGLAW